MRWLALLLLPLAGCFECEPMLDVAHCLPDSETCRPAEGQLLLFNATVHNPPWSDLPAIFTSLEPGKHYHEKWTQEQIDEYHDYLFYDDEVYFEYEENVYRVRLLSC